MMMASATRASRWAHQGAERRIHVSFEFFPPKTEEMDKQLWESVERLAPLAPNFVSVTYGAGGSTRERTHATVKRIVNETQLTPAAHLTCVDATREQVDDVIRGYRGRGRAPYRGVARRSGRRRRRAVCAASRRLRERRRPRGRHQAHHRHGSLGLGLSGKASRQRDVDADIDMLQAKVDAGASRAMTQFFFENDLYFRYLDRVRARGITIPIVPGILPVQNFKQAKNFAERTGASVPRWLAERFEGLDDDLATRKLIAAAVAAEQVIDLVDHGVTDFHFYTMNRADLVYAVCHLLGLRPEAKAAA